MGDTLFITETPFSALSSQSSKQYPASLALTSNSLLEEISTTIPLLCIGLMGFAVATCLFLTQRLTLPASIIIGAIIFAFIAALLNFSQVLLHSNGGATVTGFFVSQEVFLVVTLVLTFFFYLTYLGRPPYGELDKVSQSKRWEARKNSPAAWGASGFRGSFAYVVLAGAIFAVAILQVMWRLVANSANGIYHADGIVEILLSVAFLVKLWLNVLLSPLTPRWKTFRNYAPVTLSIFISLTIAILNLVIFEFSESSLGRFLQAIQLYILATFMLVTPFYGIKHPDKSSDIPPELSSFQGLNPRSSTNTVFRVSPRTAPSVLPTVAVPSTRPPPRRRSTPDRITTWFQRNTQLPNRRDPLQTRLWNADGSGEAATPSPNAVPTADDSPLDAKFTGAPLTVRWLDTAYNTPHDDRNLTTSPDANSRPSQEITLPTKTRAGSLLLSGRKIRLPPSLTGPPPHPLPPIPTASPAATRPTDSFGQFKLEIPKAPAPSSRISIPYYPPPRRPVSDGYPLRLTNVSRNAIVPRRALPVSLNRLDAEGVPVRPVTWATQDAFAQIDALIQDGLYTPLIVERRSSSGSSRQNSNDSGLARLGKEQEELDRSIAELNRFSTSQNVSYFAQQQDLSSRRPMPTPSVPVGRRGSSSGDGEHVFSNETIISSGVSSTTAFVPKSGSYRSEFSLSVFPSPPPVTFRASGYYPGPEERNSIIAAAKASTSSETPSSSSEGTVAKAPFVRRKRPTTVSFGSTIVPEVRRDQDKEKEAEPPTAGISLTLAGEKTESWSLKLLRQTSEGRTEGLAGVPSTFPDSRASSIIIGQHGARRMSSYLNRGSYGTTFDSQGALKAGKPLDVTSFIGDDMAPPRRPWLPTTGDRFSTDSQELSAAEIIRARSTTVVPAVTITASQAVSLSPSSVAQRPSSQPSVPSSQPSVPSSRAPLQSAMKQTSTAPPATIPQARSSRMKPPPLVNLSKSSTNNTLSSAIRVPLPPDRPRRGAIGLPQSQSTRPLSGQASYSSTGGTSATVQGRPVTAATAIASMPGTNGAASRYKGTARPDSRPGALPALPALPDLPALPAPAPAPLGIARILAEMTVEVENGDRVREKVGTRKLRTPPFPAKKAGAGTRPPQI